MKVLLLAAGRGERMKPLTDTVPKPLLEVAGEPLIGHQLRRLAAAGLCDVIVNLSWLGGQIRERLGDGSGYGVAITYSDEGPEPLETAGAVVHARGLLGDEPFIMVNADLWTDFPFASLALPAGRKAHLVLVPNPAHNAAGDFTLEADQTVRDRRVAPTGAAPTLTFSGIGIYHPSLFDGLAPGKSPLAPLLYAAADAGQVSGERHDGAWFDIGTPERLEQLRRGQEVR